jgi:hypothetical protein
VLRAAAERAAVGLLADKADRARSKLARKALQAFGAPREVRPPEVGRSARRAPGGVRDPDAEGRKLVLLIR